MPAIKYGLTGENHGIRECLLFDSATTLLNCGYSGSRSAGPGHPSNEVAHEAPATVPDEITVMHTRGFRYGPDSSLQSDVLEFMSGELAPIHPETGYYRDSVGTEAGG